MTEFQYTYDDLLNPCLKAFHDLGGSGTNAEIEEQVIRTLNLSDDEASEIHRGNTTKKMRQIPLMIPRRKLAK